MIEYEGHAPPEGGPGTIFRVYDGKRREIVNPPRRHSPDGFQWGYGGSGPADTAFALLREVLGFDPFPSMYQRFKFEVVANLPNDFVITTDQIREWIRKYENE